ncbi:putative Ring finger protein [Quillaja saponaria]|uniref:RING-type E3 ubiquitin transferase n=1 Tax=Quillaja saponaria TaxID=32244 RepID=A0AAD7Q2V2_QUISA|nr:putative Ring finger protein [Quillaja saponaria]
MYQFGFLVLLLCVMFLHVKAQSHSPGDGNANFQPSLAVVIGILSIMFSLTFLILAYAKFCHRRASIHGTENHPGILGSRSRRFSGIDKTVVESLPFFRFSSLKGTKEGLECAVCLSKFEDIEMLRLLPKCKHAFHIDCIDHWLEKHSSCPLCRHKVSSEDPTILTYSNSLRFLSNPSELGDDSNLELFVQREEHHHGSSRFSIGSSFRKTEKDNKEEELVILNEAGESDDEQRVLHKQNHKIIVSDVVFKNRWSSVSSSDLMFLNSEMLGAMSSNRLSYLESSNDQMQTTKATENEQVLNIKEEIERKRLFESKVSALKNSSVSITGIPSTSDSTGNFGHMSKYMNHAEKRSVSEITGLSRFEELGMKNRIFGGSSLIQSNVKEERMRQLWLPIARKTVQWFVNRERRSKQSQNTQQQPLDV